jgi:hypothetical protein
MNYHEKLVAMRLFVEDNIIDVQDLVAMMELTMEDVMSSMPDKLVEQYEKVYGLSEENSQDYGVGEEWQGQEEGSFDEDEGF